MSDDAAADGAAREATDAGDVTADADTDPDADERLAPGLSDDGIVLFFAALACLLAAATAHSTGQPRLVVGFALLAGAPAATAFLADVASGFVPGSGLESLVGGAALVGAAAAVPGRHYANVATLLVAGALVLWRIIDVEVRDAER